MTCKIKCSSNQSVKDCRILVVSFGSIGRRHVDNLLKILPNANISILRTRYTESQHYDLPAGVSEQFFSLNQALLFNPCAAIVASPANMHLEIARTLVKSKIPVLIEKPLSDSLDGLDDFIKDVDFFGIKAAVAYNLRFLPSLYETREILNSGLIGNVYSVRAEVGQYLPSWRPGSRYQECVSSQKKLGGGALLELSHELDYIYWMFGLPDSVMAMGGKFTNLETDVEDLVELCFEYSFPKRLVSVHLDFIQQSPYRRCRFIGEKGTLELNALSNTINLYTINSSSWKQINFPEINYNQIYIDELVDFLTIDKFLSRLPTVRDGANVLAMIHAARESIASNKLMSINKYGQR